MARKKCSMIEMNQIPVQAHFICHFRLIQPYSDSVKLIALLIPVAPEVQPDQVLVGVGVEVVEEVLLLQRLQAVLAELRGQFVQGYLQYQQVQERDWNCLHIGLLDPYGCAA